jgi:hypothetical protein
MKMSILPLRSGQALRRTVSYLCVAAWLFMTAHRLPAPIVEPTEKPTPTAEEEGTKRSAKAKRGVESQPNRATTSSHAGSTLASARAKKFAGSWVGTMSTIPWGNLPSVVTVDSTETAMAMSWYEAGEPGNPKIYRQFKPAPASERGHVLAKPAYATARLDGDTLTATFSAPLLGSSTWSITPQPGGTTARVRMQAFMNNFTAVFQRTSTVR